MANCVYLYWQLFQLQCVNRNCVKSEKHDVSRGEFSEEACIHIRVREKLPKENQPAGNVPRRRIK